MVATPEGRYSPAARPKINKTNRMLHRELTSGMVSMVTPMARAERIMVRLWVICPTTNGETQQSHKKTDMDEHI